MEKSFANRREAQPPMIAGFFQSRFFELLRFALPYTSFIPKPPAERVTSVGANLDQIVAIN